MVSVENLFKAWEKFKKGKREKFDVQVFELRLEDNLFRLHRDLIHKRYRHGPYHGFYIHDPKVRKIHKAVVRDRIVHHAIVQALNPIFEPTFIPDSYSSRVNKGAHKGVDQLEVFARKIYQTYGNCFVLKCDIRKFFSTLDHNILLKIIGLRVKDPSVLWLIRHLVRSFSSEFSQTGELGGVPIGNLTSQLFANIYMNELDWFIKRDLKVRQYIRYTDDFVIVYHDKDYLLKLQDKITNFLENKLKLSLHPDKVSIRKYPQGVDFLGYVALPKSRVLRTKVKHRIFKKMKERVLQFRAGKISEASLIQSFNSYLGILGHADSHKLEEKLRHELWESLKSL